MVKCRKVQGKRSKVQESVDKLTISWHSQVHSHLNSKIQPGSKLVNDRVEGERQAPRKHHFVTLPCRITKKVPRRNIGSKKRELLDAWHCVHILHER